MNPKVFASVCPRCGAVNDRAARIAGSEGAQPKPGNLLFCLGCDSFGLLRPSGALDAFDVESEPDPARRAKLQVMVDCWHKLKGAA